MKFSSHTRNIEACCTEGGGAVGSTTRLRSLYFDGCWSTRLQRLCPCPIAYIQGTTGQQRHVARMIGAHIGKLDGPYVCFLLTSMAKQFMFLEQPIRRVADNTVAIVVIINDVFAPSWHISLLSSPHNILRGIRLSWAHVLVMLAAYDAVAQLSTMKESCQAQPSPCLFAHRTRLMCRLSLPLNLCQEGSVARSRERRS